MEYVDGEDLASLLRRIGKLPAVKAFDLARDICAGIAAGHGLGIIHRDLKPANSMVDGGVFVGKLHVNHRSSGSPGTSCAVTGSGEKRQGGAYTRTMQPSRDRGLVAVRACLILLILSLILTLSIEAEPGVQTSPHGILLFTTLLLSIVAGLLLFGYLTAFFIFRKRAHAWRDWRFYLTFVISVLVWGLIGMVTGVIPMILMFGAIGAAGRTM